MLSDLIALKEELIKERNKRDYVVLEIPYEVGEYEDQKFKISEIPRPASSYEKRVNNEEFITDYENELKTLIKKLVIGNVDFDSIRLETSGFSVLCEKVFTDSVIERQSKLESIIKNGNRVEDHDYYDLVQYVKDNIADNVFSNVVPIHFKYSLVFNSNETTNPILEEKTNFLCGYVSFNEFCAELRNEGYSLHFGRFDTCESFDDYLSMIASGSISFDFLSLAADFKKSKKKHKSIRK